MEWLTIGDALKIAIADVTSVRAAGAVESGIANMSEVNHWPCS